MSEEETVEIPLKPASRSEIHRLEAALIIATLLREDVLQRIRESTERLTWIDSLAVAAGAFARARAGMTASQIAEDLGRSEATVRRHLSGRTEAAKLIEETYRKFLAEGVRIELPAAVRGEEPQRARELESRVRELEERVRALEEENRELRSKVEAARKLAEELVGALKGS